MYMLLYFGIRARAIILSKVYNFSSDVNKSPFLVMISQLFRCLAPGWIQTMLTNGSFL